MPPFFACVKQANKIVELVDETQLNLSACPLGWVMGCERWRREWRVWLMVEGFSSVKMDANVNESTPL